MNVADRFITTATIATLAGRTSVRADALAAYVAYRRDGGASASRALLDNLDFVERAVAS